MSSQESAQPRPVEEGEIKWVRHLMRDERNLVLSANDKSMVVLYSLVEELPGLNFRLLWRSYPEAEHSRYVDSYSSSREGAPVTALLYDSSSRNPYLRMKAEAWRLPRPEFAAASELMRAVRKQRGEEVLNPFSNSEIFYEARIHEFAVPVPLLRNGEKVGSGYAILDPAQLSGFRGDSPLV